jgi:hypothetical protein
LQTLLQCNKTKTRKLSELSKTEQNRLAKLYAMLETLRSGKNVQNHQLATWLTEEEYEQFQSEWKSQKQIRDELKEKPEKLKRYENKLHQATFNDNKAERFLKKGNTVNSLKFSNLSESLCEDALEILQDLADADASLQHWFDRALDVVVSLPRETVGLITERLCRNTISEQNYFGNDCEQ